jgi:hypothetical protein
LVNLKIKMLINKNKLNLTNYLGLFFFLFNKFIIKLEFYGILFYIFNNDSKSFNKDDSKSYKKQVKIPFYFLNFFNIFFLFFKFFSSLFFILNYYFFMNPFFFFNLELNLKLIYKIKNDLFIELNLNKKKEKINLLKFKKNYLNNFIIIYKKFINKKLKKLSKKSFFFLLNLDEKNKLIFINSFFFKDYIKYYFKRNLKKNASIIDFFDFKFILKYFFFFRKDILFILKTIDKKIIRNFFQKNSYNFLLFYFRINKEEYRQKKINDKFLKNKFYFIQFFTNNHVYKHININNSFLFLRNSYIYSKIKKNVKMDYIYFQKLYIYTREIFYFFSTFVRIIMKFGQKKKSRKIISKFFIKLKRSKLNFFKILRLFVLKVLPSCGMILAIKGKRKKQFTYFSLFNRLKSVSVLSRWLKEACLKKKSKLFFDSIFIEILDTLLKKSYVFNKYTINYFSVIDFAKIAGKKKRIKKFKRNLIIKNQNKKSLLLKKNKIILNKMVLKKKEFHKISSKLKYVYERLAMLKSKKLEKKKLLSFGVNFKKFYGYFNKNKTDKNKFRKFFNRTETKLRRKKEKKKIKLKNLNNKIKKRIKIKKVLRKFSAFYLSKFNKKKNKKLKLNFIKNYKKKSVKKIKRLPKKIFYKKLKKKKTKNQIKKVLKRSNIYFIFNLIKNFEKFFFNLEDKSKLNFIFMDMFSNKNSYIVDRISKNFINFNELSLNFLEDQKIDLNSFLEQSNSTFSIENFKLIFKNYILKKISKLKIKYLSNFDILKSISLKKFYNKNIYLNYYLLKKLDLLKYNFNSIYFNKYIWLNYILKKKGFLKRLEFSKIDALNLKNIVIRIYLYFYFIDFFYINNKKNYEVKEKYLNKKKNKNIINNYIQRDMSYFFYSNIFESINKLFKYSLSFYGNKDQTTYKSLSVSIFFYVINTIKDSKFDFLFKNLLKDNHLFNYIVKKNNIKLFFKNFKYFNFFSKINSKKSLSLFSKAGNQVDINYLNFIYTDINQFSKRLSEKLAYKGQFVYNFYLNEIKNKNYKQNYKDIIFKDSFTFHYYFLNFKLNLEKEVYLNLLINLNKFFRIKFLKLILTEYKFRKKKKFKLNILKLLNIKNLKTIYYNIIFNKYYIINKLRKLSFKNLHKKITYRSFFFMQIFKLESLNFYLNFNYNKIKTFFNNKILQKKIESIDFNIIKENINEKYFDFISNKFNVNLFYKMSKKNNKNILKFRYFKSLKYSESKINNLFSFKLINKKIKDKILINMKKNTKENFLLKKNKVSLFNFKNKSNTLRKYRYILDSYLEQILKFKIIKENTYIFDLNFKYKKNIINFFIYLNYRLFFFKFININKKNNKNKQKNPCINKVLKKNYIKEIAKEEKIKKKIFLKSNIKIKNSFYIKKNEYFVDNLLNKKLCIYLNNFYYKKIYFKIFKKIKYQKNLITFSNNILYNNNNKFLHKKFINYYINKNNNKFFFIYFNKFIKQRTSIKNKLFYKTIKNF